MLSTEVTMLMSMPRRLACSRSTTRVICWVPPPSRASMAVSSGSALNAATTFGYHSRRADSSLLCRV
ncbi:hypothetical protein D3C72_2546760 [compost metagenome]